MRALVTGCSTGIGRATALELDKRGYEVIATARKLLLENISDGQFQRVTTRGDPSAHGAAVYVYGKAGRPCRRCGSPIRTRRQGQLNRPTYWCPRCQPASA